jgi:hypothetical protein
VSTCLRAEALQHAKACLRAIAGTSACEGKLRFYLLIADSSWLLGVHSVRRLLGLLKNGC